MNIPICIEDYGNNMFIAWINSDSFKGIVVQGESKEDVMKEIKISIRVKIAYDYGLSIIDNNKEPIAIENKPTNHKYQYAGTVMLQLK